MPMSLVRLISPFCAVKITRCLIKFIINWHIFDLYSAKPEASIFLRCHVRPTGLHCRLHWLNSIQNLMYIEIRIHILTDIEWLAKIWHIYISHAGKRIKRISFTERTVLVEPKAYSYRDISWLVSMILTTWSNTDIFDNGAYCRQV